MGAATHARTHAAILLRDRSAGLDGAAPVCARLPIGFGVLGVVDQRVCQLQSRAEVTFTCQPETTSSDPRWEQMAHMTVTEKDRERERRSALRSRPTDSPTPSV